ncbi:hypothetical protein KP002_16965 [Geomonas subterranea]|nr:hypothetical protein KP002_16965 [Geomonas subterranea]
MRPEIKQALDDGWPIFNHLEDTARGGDGDLRLRLVPALHEAFDPDAAQPKSETSGTTAGPTRMVRSKTETPPISGFTFNLKKKI